MNVLAIDPGSSHSAFVILSEAGRVTDHAKMPNAELLEFVRTVDRGYKRTPVSTHHLAIELAESFGAKVWAQVFTTTLWAGRFVEAFGGAFTTLGRREIKVHVTGSARAKDQQVRQCLLERWGGKDKALGTKQQPGPLHGLTADRWAALAVAVTYSDRQLQSYVLGQSGVKQSVAGGAQ